MIRVLPKENNLSVMIDRFQHISHFLAIYRCTLETQLLTVAFIIKIPTKGLYASDIT